MIVRPLTILRIVRWDKCILITKYIQGSMVAIVGRENLLMLVVVERLYVVYVLLRVDVITRLLIVVLVGIQIGLKDLWIEIYMNSVWSIV